MEKFTAFILISILAFLCHPSAEAGVFPRHLNFPSTAVVHKQFNFHVVAPGVWRSGATNKKTLKRMKRQGLRTVVNLRRSKSYHKKERDIAQKLGLQYHHFPMDPRKAQDRAYLQSILSVISDPANQPVLVHCRSGKDRTGLIAGLYKLQQEEVSVEAVYKEMLLYGYNPRKYPEIGRTVRDWSGSPSTVRITAPAVKRIPKAEGPFAIRSYSSWLRPFGLSPARKSRGIEAGLGYETRVYSSILGRD